MYTGDSKKYSFLSKRKMHNRVLIFESEIFLDYQRVNFDTMR